MMMMSVWYGGLGDDKGSQEEQSVRELCNQDEEHAPKNGGSPTFMVTAPTGLPVDSSPEP